MASSPLMASSLFISNNEHKFLNHSSLSTVLLNSSPFISNKNSPVRMPICLVRSESQQPPIKNHHFNKNYSETRKLVAGVRNLAKKVAVTYGPVGRYGIISKNPARFENDCLAIATELKLEDDIEQMGVDIVRHAIEKTKNEVGDGTKTMVILAGELCHQGFFYLETLDVSHVTPLSLVRGMKKTCDYITDLMDEVQCGDAVVVGGGTALVRLKEKAIGFADSLIGGEQVGGELFGTALLAPLSVIAKNKKGVLVKELVYNDEVIRCCIKNATDVATVMLLADRFTVDRKEQHLLGIFPT